MALPDLVAEYLASLPGATRVLGPRQWGVTVDSDQAGGWPLDIGLRVRDGLLLAQAPVAEQGERLDPWLFLHWNRQTRLVRFSATREGEVWIQGDLAVESVDAPALDRLLGLIVEGALVGRRYA
ncbi:MAG: YbjN domain-containing protein, partial [Thermoleophilaceae bacterium]|nr:YbjN domain-containing protein [Thermoleophilaceae bacterium]